MEIFDGINFYKWPPNKNLWGTEDTLNYLYECVYCNKHSKLQKICNFELYCNWSNAALWNFMSLIFVFENPITASKSI